MALKGTLKDFSISDIFQLIGQQTKSGSLYVRNNEQEAHIVFDAGKVVLGTFRKSNDEFLLGTMLLRAGVITQDQLNQAMENQKVTLRSLGDILRGMGAITPPVLGEFVGLQVKEVLFRLFQWREGFYEFVSEQLKYNKAIIKPMSAEGVLMDGFRMLDEWPGVSEKVGSLDSIFRRIVDPVHIATKTKEVATEDPFAMFGGENPPQEPKEEEDGALSLTQEERAVLEKMDVERSAKELIAISRLGTFETARILAILLDRGMIQKTDQLASAPLRALSQSLGNETFSGWLKARWLPLTLGFFLALLTPVLAYRTKSHWSHRLSPPSSYSGIPKTERIPLFWMDEINQKIRLRLLLDSYRLEKGHYPLSLEDLNSPLLTDHWSYEISESEYVLSWKAAAP